MHLMWRLIRVLPFVLFVQISTLQPVGHVNDFAQLFSSQYQMELEEKLSKLEDVEIAVVTLPSLDGKPVEMVAREIFDEWQIGKKGKDNGLLLLVAMKDRSLRIEVGYGLEGVLPDGVCGRIIRQDMTPLFSAGKYEAGTSKAIESLVARIHGENVSSLEGVMLIVVFGLVVFVLILLIAARFGFFRYYSAHPLYRSFPNQYGGFASGGPGGFGGFGGGKNPFGGFGGGSGGGGGASGKF